MPEVLITPGAQAEFERLPLGMKGRVRDVFLRLAHWPEVSGAKPLQHELRGAFRIRAGDFRMIFRIDDRSGNIIVHRIANRRDVYE